MTFDLSSTVLQMASVTSSIAQLIGPPALDLGVGGVIGWAIGRVLKAVLKIVLIVMAVLGGILAGCFYWFESIGVVTGCAINYSNLSNVGANAVAWGTGELGGLIAFASTISFLGVGFSAGLALGFKG